MTNEWHVIPHRDVKRKDELLLQKANLFEKYMHIIKTLKENPFSRKYHHEMLQPKAEKIYSMRINSKHRVVYTVDKKAHLIKIWSAWSHYEQRKPT
ncbi:MULTISPECIES: Txe/YoeB family addiction module toxin [Lacticaseibacillus]|uniref:Txe/YoeB family addiction module toxin n=1 Tax=Lacticaseibacillus TaxID=2759736 RepID=UPI00063DC7AD|nr:MULTISPECIES: Txe/YoeB family addiction module toxin [Lacticaseibacillus]KLI75660.1 addiction module toxin YoeB [Lacticaseibacillus casei]